MRDFLVGVFATLAAVNLLAFLYATRDRKLTPVGAWYSYLGEDYPRTLPMELGPFIDVTYRKEWEHLEISELPDAAAAWEALIPPGHTFVHLGPNKRRFSVSMFHQLHCLTVLKQALSEGSITPHLTHCLNYLVHAVLCGADTTLEAELEPVALQAGVPKVNHYNVTHSCRDWSKVYEFMIQNYWD